MSHLDVVVSLSPSVGSNRQSNSLLVPRWPQGIIEAFFATALFMLCNLLAATAQTTGPVTTQGIPPFSLQSNAGGGIDSINLGNLDIFLSIPLNSNGGYGPKSSAALVMESGFPLVLQPTVV